MLRVEYLLLFLVKKDLKKDDADKRNNVDFIGIFQHWDIVIIIIIIIIVLFEWNTPR